MSTRYARLGAACERFGPGRLPRADDRTIGAGYACASNALLSCLAFALLTVPFVLANPDGVAGFWAVLALLAAPIVVPAAFVAGYASWRVLPARTPAFGAVAGALATGLTYCIATVGFVALNLVRRSARGMYAGDAEWALGAVAGSVVIAFVAFLLSFWVTVPIGVGGGYVYERVRRESGT